MLKLDDYGSWSKIYKKTIQSALRLIDPANVEGPEDGREKIFYDLPWRLAPELRFLLDREDFAKNYLGFTHDEMGIIYNAAPILHERVVYGSSGRSTTDDLDFEQLDFSSFLKMLLMTPVATLLECVGTSSVQISSYHGFTNLDLETVGKSVRAKISHHQNDPTLVYGMPEILSKYAWDCFYDMDEQKAKDSNGFQALYYLPKLDFEEAIDAIISTFTDAMARGIHYLGKFAKADGRLLRINLTAQDSDFDRYLSEHNDFVQKFWMHHYLHVRLNERYE